MRSILLIISVIFIFSIQLKAQKIFSAEYESSADIKVFVVDYESRADLCVFKEEYESSAKGNKGLWYFVKYVSNADKKIFFVNNESNADLKIFFVNYKSRAGWKNKSKMQLLY